MENRQASEVVEKEEVERIEKEAPAASAQPDKVCLSVDGAFVALTTGEWCEVKTAALYIDTKEFETVPAANRQEKV